MFHLINEYALTAKIKWERKKASTRKCARVYAPTRRCTKEKHFPNRAMSIHFVSIHFISFHFISIAIIFWMLPSRFNPSSSLYSVCAWLYIQIHIYIRIISYLQSWIRLSIYSNSADTWQLLFAHTATHMHVHAVHVLANDSTFDKNLIQSQMKVHCWLGLSLKMCENFLSFFNWRWRSILRLMWKKSAHTDMYN